MGNTCPLLFVEGSAAHADEGNAKALAPEIAVNAVAPGMIDLGDPAAKAFMRKMAKVTPMKRNGTGDEIATAVRFFAEAPHFITGQILAVDGGLALSSSGE